MNIENYEKFLDLLTTDLNAMFKYQKEYMCCKEGCALCCQQGEYPFSELEFDYLMYGFEKLSPDIKEKILTNIKELQNSSDDEYSCPFLINNSCSLYKYRGIVCRTFGLITARPDKSLTIPFCAKHGLNYSKVFDPEKKQILIELFKKYNYIIPPRVFNISYQNIMSLDLAKELELDFGEVKRLKDWLKDKGI